MASAGCTIMSPTGWAAATVVCAEGSWTMEEPNERMRYGKTFGTDQGKIRWDTVAEGLGCAAFYAESPEQLASVLDAAKAAGATPE